MNCKKLSEIANVVMGQSPKGPTFNADGIGEPFMQGRKTFGRMYPTIDTWTTDPTKHGESGAILFSVRAPVGDMNIAPCDLCIGRGLCAITGKDGFDTKYIYYLLCANIHKIKDKVTGTIFESVNRNDLLETKLPIHEKDDRDRITKILSDIDAKIECNNRTNDNLFEVCEQLLNQYLSKASQNSRTIADFLNVFTGKKNANETNPDGKYVFFSCAPETLRSDTYIYDGPAIIIAGNGAYTGRTRFYDGKMELYQRTYACVPKNAEIKRLIYGFYIYMKTHFEREKMGGTHGSAIPYIVIGDITKYEIPYEEDMFKNYAINVTPLVKKIQDNITENRRLTKLRDTLLPELLNGKVDVSNIDI